MPFVIKNNIIPFSAFRQISEIDELDPSFVHDIILFLSEWFDDDLYEITQMTSGSTGPPKRIQLPKKMMVQSALKTISYFNLVRESFAVLCLPIKYIAGKMMLVRAIQNDMNLMIVNPNSNPLRNIDSHVDFIALTPHQLYNGILSNEISLENIRTILLGGAPVSKALLNRIKRLEVSCYLSYGMTETASHVAIQVLNGKSAGESFEGLAGVSFSVDEDNCLLINSDYINETIETNDIVKLISNNKFIWIGRKDNLINSGGLKISPEKMESDLSGFIKDRFIVSSIPDDKLGQRLLLIIEQKTKLTEESKNELICKMKTVLSSSIVPEIIINLPSFNYSHNSKILREETRSLAAPLISNYSQGI